MSGTPLPKVILRPYPHPECLPAGIVCHLWEAWTYEGTAQRIATGDRPAHRAAAHVARCQRDSAMAGARGLLAPSAAPPRDLVWLRLQRASRDTLRASRMDQGGQRCARPGRVSHTGIGFF